jgi:hypothetical protein
LISSVLDLREDYLMEKIKLSICDDKLTSKGFLGTTVDQEDSPYTKVHNEIENLLTRLD